VETEVFAVVTANTFHVELLPAVTVLGFGGVRVFFSQRRDVGLFLPVAGINAGARSVEITLDAVAARGFDRVEIDKRVVADDDGLIVLDETDAAHVSGE